MSGLDAEPGYEDYLAEWVSIFPSAAELQEQRKLIAKEFEKPRHTKNAVANTAETQPSEQRVKAARRMESQCCKLSMKLAKLQRAMEDAGVPIPGYSSEEAAPAPAPHAAGRGRGVLGRLAGRRQRPEPRSGDTPCGETQCGPVGLFL